MNKEQMNEQRNIFLHIYSEVSARHLDAVVGHGSVKIESEVHISIHTNREDAEIFRAKTGGLVVETTAAGLARILPKREYGDTAFRPRKREKELKKFKQATPQKYYCMSLPVGRQQLTHCSEDEEGNITWARVNDPVAAVIFQELMNSGIDIANSSSPRSHSRCCVRKSAA